MLTCVGCFLAFYNQTVVFIQLNIQTQKKHQSIKNYFLEIAPHAAVNENVHQFR